ncbi:MAG: hypothetical protein JOS17DRAFT_351389 [Linnemannia elongata]|nr:MAG: hypothetical protein JOS17DRAFT_351389 [Linnemannia elongata]
MTDFAQERPSIRSRGASQLKLNLLQQQHPLDMGFDDRDMDIDLDGMVGYDTSLPSVPSLSKNATSTTTESVVPFVSAHPSPEVSDESDGERERGLNLSSKDDPSISDRRQAQAPSSSSSSAMPAPVAVPVAVNKNKSSGRRGSHMHHHAPDAEEELSFHLLLSPIPIPQQHHHSRSHHARRTPPQSPLSSFSNSHSHSHSFKRSSFSSMSSQTPPGSATAAFPVPCSDSALVDELIRNNVRQHMRSHATEKAYFWSLGKLSEFSFSDRFVRSPVFDIKDTAPAAGITAPVATNSEASSIPTDGVLQSQTEPAKSSWRLRLYPVSNLSYEHILHHLPFTWLQV